MTRQQGAGTGPNRVHVEVSDDDFMRATARDDRKRTKAKHLADGIKGALELVDRMKKGLAFVQATRDDELQARVLSDVADTAAQLASDARLAVVNAKRENRNAQPSRADE